MKTLVAAALSALALAAPARSATLFLSSSATNPAAVSNPTITVALGSTSTLYASAQLGPINGTTEKIIGIGVDVISTNPAILTGLTPADTSYAVATSAGGFNRWTAVTNAVGGDLFSNVILIAITTDGLDGNRTPDAVGTGGERFYKLFSINYHADQLGTTDLFFRTNHAVIALETNRGGTDNHFGAGDAAVNFSQNGGGVQSALADATIIVAPLPAVPTTFAALASLAAFGRRRRA